MTTTDLLAQCERMKELSAKATKGPWALDVTSGALVIHDELIHGLKHEDVAFIAASRAFAEHWAKVGTVVIETLEKVANGDLGTLYGGRAAAIKTLSAILSEVSGQREEGK